MSQPITGGCLCGAIRYTVSEPVQNIIACHCVNCRKATGSGASHNAILPMSAVTFTQGKTKVFTDTADNGNKLYRHFCGDCGSPIMSQRAAVPERTVLKAGTLDAPEQLKITMDVWTRSALPWMHIDPATEHFTHNRPIRP